MKTTLIPLSLIIIGLASTILGCSATQSGGPVGNASPLGDWTLWLIEGETTDTAVPRTAKTPTLRVAENGQVSGIAGVNNYTGQVLADELAQGKFTLGSVIATRMAGPPQAMALETRFLNLLQQADTIDSNGSTLALRSGGKVLLRFKHADSE